MSALRKIVILLGIATILYPTNIHAADTLSEGSLAISPFLIETQIRPGQTQEQTITIFNVTNSPLPITVSINDFVPSGNTGGVRFLDDGQLPHQSFSLASWITITKQPEFIIEPGKTTSITFKIQVPLEAEPGTHYGGLLFAAPDNTQSSANTKVIRKVGALILVATGNTNASGNIQSFSTDKKFYTTPTIGFFSAFENTGNVHLSPKGQVDIKNMFGHTVKEAHLNPNAQYILPGSEREFTDSIKTSWMFGRYTANLTFWYGNPKLESHAQITFWVLPIKTMTIHGGGGLLLALLGFLSIKRYNRWVIKRSGNS